MPLVQQELLELQVHPGNQELKDHLVHRDLLVQQDHQDQLANKEMLGKLDNQDRKASLEVLVQLDFQEHLALRVPMVNKGRRDRTVFPDQQELLVRQELQDHPVSRVHQETMDLQDQRANQGH